MVTAAHDAAVRRRDDVLHLHRLDHGDVLPLPHRIAGRDVDAHHRALDRRGTRRRSVRPGQIRALPRLRPSRRAQPSPRVVGKQRQRIAALHPRAGETRAASMSRQTRRSVARCSAPAAARAADVIVDPARVDMPDDEIGMRQDGAQERNVGADALHPEFARAPARRVPPRQRNPVRANARSPWRAANRMRRWCDSRRSRTRRSARPARSGLHRRSVCRRRAAPSRPRRSFPC